MIPAYASLRDTPVMKRHATQKGFTLIELMVALIIGLVLMAGIYSNFIMQSSVQSMQSDVTERMEDLYLASHIMQGELRSAGSIDISTVNEINYTDLESNAGVFRYTSSTTPANSKICWDSPTAGGGCQELIRNLDATTGFVVSSSGTGSSTIYTITMNASYVNKEHNTQAVGLSFKIWPRN